MKTIKHIVRNVLGAFGYKLSRITDVLGRDAMADMRRMIGAHHRAIIIDAGANNGWSSHTFKTVFQHAQIHAFEPCADTFKSLRSRVGGCSGITINNVALGATDETAPFYEHGESDMNSFFAPGPESWVTSARVRTVHVETLDNYCAKHGIAQVDILKSDTQGFDLNVLKGAKALFEANAVRLVYVELIFCDLYRDMPFPEEIIAFLRGVGMELVSIYNFDHKDGRARWADGLFVNRNYAPSSAT